jgi:hypothetical protein
VKYKLRRRSVWHTLHWRDLYFTVYLCIYKTLYYYCIIVRSAVIVPCTQSALMKGATYSRILYTSSPGGTRAPTVEVKKPPLPLPL